MSERQAAEAVVQFDGVSFSYGERPVLQDVTFTLRRGEFVAVLGPNGGGKTTLLRLILGLLEPASGSIHVFGSSPREAGDRLGYVPQYLRFDPRFPVQVLDVVLMGRLGPGRAGFYRAADREAARGALAAVGVEELAGRSFAELSGGQRQRVLIARALACRPELLLLDEPTANVDRVAERMLQELLSELGRRLTVRLVSHDVGFVTRAVSWCLCVNRTVLVHPTAELDGTLVSAFYGAPMQVVRHERVAAQPRASGTRE